MFTPGDDREYFVLFLKPEKYLCTVLTDPTSETIHKMIDEGWIMSLDGTVRRRLYAYAARIEACWPNRKEV